MKTEYVIWGIAPGKEYEEPLYTKANTMAAAREICETLKTKYGCRSLRVQVIDFTESNLSRVFVNTINH